MFWAHAQLIVQEGGKTVDSTSIFYFPTNMIFHNLWSKWQKNNTNNEYEYLFVLDKVAAFFKRTRFREWKPKRVLLTWQQCKMLLDELYMVICMDRVDKHKNLKRPETSKCIGNHREELDQFIQWYLKSYQLGCDLNIMYVLGDNDLSHDNY